MNSYKVNAFIIGAQKAGTTSLYQWLGQHPEINAPQEIKDYHFFSNDQLFVKGLSHFNSLYSNNRDKVQLHAAVNYLYFYEKSAKRLYEYNPDAKIIICLRDPVTRSISAYKYFMRLFREDRSFEDALTREMGGELSDKELPDLTYLAHGNYFEQIEGFLHYFKREQIHFVLFEELTNSDYQVKALKEIMNFLDIDDTYKIEFTHLNKSRKPKSYFINWLIRESKIPKWFKNIIPFTLRKSIGIKLNKKNISDEEFEINVTEKNQKWLKDYYSDSVKKLNSFLDKDVTKYWDI